MLSLPGEDVPREKVDQVCQVLPAEIASGIHRRQDAFQLVVPLLKGLHRVIDLHLDVVVLSMLDEVAPPGLLRNQKGPLTPVFHGVVEVGGRVEAVRLLDLLLQLVPAFFVPEGQVPEEEKGQDVVLVVRRGHGAPEVFGGLPQLVFDFEVGVELSAEEGLLFAHAMTICSVKSEGRKGTSQTYQTLLRKSGTPSKLKRVRHQPMVPDA